MADILIRMEMPKCCCCCPCFNDEYWYCQAADMDLGRIPVESRHPNCTLIELPSHGSLIDKRALVSELHNTTFFDGDDRMVVYKVIDAIPTVIEASEESI